MGRHKFQFAPVFFSLVRSFSALRFCRQFSRFVEGESRRMILFFSRRILLAAYLIWGSLFAAWCLSNVHWARIRSNHNVFFMCYLHTIYSDFPQFKINYVSLFSLFALSICKCTSEQNICLWFTMRNQKLNIKFIKSATNVKFVFTICSFHLSMYRFSQLI